MSKVEAEVAKIEDFPVVYKPDFLSSAEERLVFGTLWEGLDWERREKVPRKEYWTNIFDRPYTYGSGMGERTYYPRPTHPSIEMVSDALEAELGFRYEGCFLNGYKDSSDSLGPHADDDTNIDHSKPIAVVTVGDGRDIECRAMTGGPKLRVFLEPGSLFLMKPGMQSTHLHRIPKAGFIVKRPRISLTFRALKNED